MWETFKEIGPLAWPIVAAGALGSLASILALILAAKRAPRALHVAVAATALGALAALLGGAGVLYLRRVTEAAIVDTQASPLEAEKLRREGYAEARRPARLGLWCAAFPLLAGTAAMFAARRRRPSLEAAGLALPIGMTVAGLLSAGGAAAGASAPLPGRAIPLDAPDWVLLEHVEHVQKAEGSEALLAACRRLEIDLEDGLSSPIAELPAAARRCVEDRVAQAVILAPIERVHRALEAIARSPLTQRDPEAVRMVQHDLAEVVQMMAEPPPFDPDDVRGFRARPPRVRMGAVSVNGRLPAEVVQRIVRRSFGRFRLCYENGLRENPSLAGRVSVRFLIGRNGETAQVTNAGSTLPSATVVACVLRAFAGLSFPQPEGGTVVVTYPITLSPGA